jgi:multidrug efflux pump subunit AcrB
VTARPEAHKAGALFDHIAAHQRFIYMAVSLLSAAGIWAALKLPSAVYPELQFQKITVVVEGSTLSARQQIFAITRPIEEAVSIVPGVIRVSSRSIRGATEMPITFAEGTDMASALEQVRLRVDQIRGDLPPGLDVQIERMTPTLFPILQYNIEGGDPATLYDIARYQLKPVVSRVPGVGRVDVQGSDVREIEVIADPARLASAGLTYDDLATAIKSGISVDAVGRVAADYKQYLVISAQEAHSAEDIANVVVKGAVRVRDVALVVPGTEDHVRVVAGDGRPAALLNITRQPGGNTIAISDSVAHTMAAISKSLPSGVRVKAVYDQASLVTDAVHSVRDAMLIGAILAVIILLLFLRDLRITAISATAIPLTLTITVFVMQQFGQTFNLMTLGAMAIAIGLVIDDAVVITENIVRHMQLDSDKKSAIRLAVQELIWPVTTSTITTVVVFLPLGQLEGVAGQFFAALSLTLTVSVLVSLVLAFTIIPLLSARFLASGESARATDEKKKSGIFGGIGRALDSLSDKYESALGSALHHTRITIIMAVVLVGLGIGAYTLVGTGFLPDMDEGAFILDYWSPGGTSLVETDRQLHIIEGILGETPEVTGTSRRLGAELGLFATTQNRGDISVRLKPQSERKRDIFKIMDEVRGKVAEAVPRFRVEFHQILSDVLSDASGEDAPVVVKLFGPDIDALEQYAGVLAPKVGKIDGLDDFYSGIAEPAAEMEMKIKGDEATRLGLSPQQVSAEVSGALLGVPAGEIHLDDRAIGVRVRASDSVRYNAQRLAALPVYSPQTKQSAPLGTLAEFTPSDVRSENLRENEQQLIQMTATVNDRPLSAVMKEVKSILAENEPPSGVRVELGGRYASQQKAFAALLLVLALAAVSVTAVMVIQFRSFVDRDGHGAERRELHGIDSAGRAHREERHHPARFHEPSHEIRGRRSGNRNSRSGACASPPDSHDDAVHAVRAHAARARTRCGKRDAKASRACGRRRPRAVDADHAFCGAGAPRRDPRTQLLPAQVMTGGCLTIRLR